MPKRGIRRFSVFDTASLHRPDGQTLALRTRTALAVFGSVGVTAMALATTLMLWDLRAKELERTERESETLCQMLAEQTARAVQSADLILTDTRDRLSEGHEHGYLMDERALHTLFRARIGGVPQVHALFRLDAEGVVGNSASQFPAQRLRLGDADYFKAHAAAPGGTGLYIGKPTQARIDGAWIVPMSRRLTGAGGEFLGVLVAELDLAYFAQLYQSIRVREGSEVSLYLRDGTLLARHPAAPAAIGQSFAASAIFSALEADRGSTPGGRLLTKDASPSIVAFREVSDFPLVVAVSMDEHTALSDWRRQATLMGVSGAGVMLLLVLAGAALARELSRDQVLTQALIDSESRLDGIIESAMDAIVTIDEDQRVVLFNSAAERMFGCSATQALGAPLERFIPMRFVAHHRARVEHFGATGSTPRSMGQELDIRALRADGEEFPADVSISQLVTAGKKFYTAIIRDVTRRRMAEAELRESHQQLRALSASLQSVREEERTRIAREIHDELGQQLTGLKMDLAWMAARVREDQGGLAAKISGMKGLIDATVASMRRIASELRPLMLDDLGLEPAIEWLAADFSRRTGIEVITDLDITGAECDPALATGLFRIVQESLTNVTRHAEATRVDIRLRAGTEEWTLEVRDNGKGMTSGSGERKTFGLIGMRERAYMFGGQMQIGSSEGEGTALRVTIPSTQPDTVEQHS